MSTKNIMESSIFLGFLLYKRGICGKIATFSLQNSYEGSVAVKNRLIPVAVILLAALLFTSSCTGSRTTSPFPDAEAGMLSEPESTATPSPNLTPPSSPVPQPTPSPSPAPLPTPVPYEGEEIAQYALQFNGYRYNYGGMDPSTGFDCSGLVYYVFRQFGYKLNRVAEGQALNGSKVEKQEDLLPGDIVCFSWITSSYINHVGIYIGDGKFIHAMDSAHDVLITKLDEYLETHRCVMRRIVGAEEKLSLSVIEALERQDAEALAARMAEEERIAAEQAKNASPTPTPPPAFIPDAGAISKAEAEEQHRKEIEEAWRAIWEEEESSLQGIEQSESEPVSPTGTEDTTCSASESDPEPITVSERTQPADDSLPVSPLEADPQPDDSSDDPFGPEREPAGISSDGSTIIITG